MSWKMEYGEGLLGCQVYPLEDLSEHDIDGECWCEPEVQWIDEETGLPYPCGPIVIHNAADGRELTE